MMTTATERVMETMVRDGVPCRCSLCADIRAALDEAVAAERARCAAVCREVAAEWLATALDGAVRAEAARGLDGEAAVAAMRATVAGTGRVATKLRAVMAAEWREMEGGR